MMKMYFFLQNYLMNEQSTILAQISGKPVSQYGRFSMTSLFGSSTIYLHQDGISSTTRTWGLKDERFIPIRQISSASIIEVRNILWLIIGLLNLWIFIGIIFIILYFVLTEKHIVLTTEGNALALRYKSQVEKDAYAFIKKAFECIEQSHKHH